EQLVHPVGNHGAAGFGETARAGEAHDRQDARHDRNAYSRANGEVTESQEVVAVEEELRDGPGGAGILLGLERLDVLVEVARLGVFLRVGSDADVEIAAAANGRHQLVGAAVGTGGEELAV